MKTLLVSCFLVMVFSSNNFAQELNKSFFEEKVGYNILIDRCDKKGLQGSEFGEYFNKQYAGYKIDESILKALKRASKKFKIKIILGTWCGDSKRQVPRFYKILDQIKFKEKNLEIHCVDRAKKTHAYSIENLNIEFVPTFIFYKNGKEIGRIIESPETTLEQDFLNIIK